MNNKLIVLTLILAGCSDTATFINGKDGKDFDDARVAELERRADLNEQLDQAQSALINLNTANIAALSSDLSALELDLRNALEQEMLDRIAGDMAMQDLLDQEESARIAGDSASMSALAAAIAYQAFNNAAQQAAINSLQAQLATQAFINGFVQSQISSINSKFPTINSKLSSLQSQVNSTNSNLSALSGEVDQLQLDLSNLTVRMTSAEGGIADLEDALSDLQAQVDAEGVKVFKCNAASSTERVLKINNKFYGAMNRVTTQSVQVVTGSSSQSISTPLLCKKSGNDELKLADADGDCNGSSWNPVAGTGTTTTVPSYSMANVTVVTSVKIALDILNGSYNTTDGGAPCSFTVSGGSSTNLVQVQ